MEVDPVSKIISEPLTSAYGQKGVTVMGFGPIMQMEVGELNIELAPLSKEVMNQFIKQGGMQQRSVTRYLNSRSAPVLEDELEWFEKTRTDAATVLWGVWDATGKSKILIGSTGLHGIEGSHMRQATSGILLFRQEYWGKGIASYTHRARTWYAFTQLGLTRIKSAVMVGNDASYKALFSVGYQEVFVERNTIFADGVFSHQRNLECLNPLEPFWSTWWGTDAPTKTALSARKRTESALLWATEKVKLL